MSVQRDYYALGLVGYPLGHSLSPRLHTALLRAAGLKGAYRLYPAAPSDQGLEELKLLLEKVRSGKLQGLNVTIPHKQRLLPFLDRLSATALEVGAVNTVFCQDGKLIGENTDVPGFEADLKHYLPALPAKDAHALVIGAGGSARAIVCALGRSGWNVWVAARRLEQSQEVAAYFSELGYCVETVLWNQTDLAECMANHPVQLIVNTTPLGMGSLKEVSPWLEGLAFPKHALVYDLVYNPAETFFLHQARAAGLRAANGLGMLLEQAALSFACWTGIRPSPDILCEALQEKPSDQVL
jgi:shikimate dehydrogenase